MDFHDPELMDDDYPYSDYYSTGGKYRPPKTPRNHGWIAAALGALLLCVTGGAVLLRSQGSGSQAPQPSPSIAYEEVSAGNGAAAAEQTQGETAEAPVLNGEAVLSISKDPGEELSFQEIYKKVIPSVASISAQLAGGVATGTGIVMSADGYIITNYHVVSSASKITVLLSSGEQYPAARVGSDETSDLMVLKIEAEGLTPAEFGDSEQVEVGDTVVAIGDPMGIELRGTMTDGIICGINRDVSVGDRTMTLIQTNAALNSGNSGGPLVNMQGQVIGINTMKLTSTDYTPAEGLGFAIPISAAKPIVDELTAKGYVTGRPAVGFTLETLESRIVLFYSLPGRLMVHSVDQNSDAYEKGIRAGDIITAIEGTPVSTVDEFNLVKNDFSAGDQVTLVLYRDRETYEVTVELMDQAELRKE